MQLQPLHDDFGVEVLGLDLERDPAAGDLDQLQAAFDRHHLLLFRPGRRLAPERQVAVTGWFGRLLPAGPDGGYWTLMSNEDAVGSAPLRFHSDLTYTDSPFDGISLHALEVPHGGTTTSFASGARAWARLPAPLRERLAPMTARHRLPATQLFGADWPDFVADQPVRLEHPRTGEPVLFVTEEHAERIHQLPQAESEAVLAGLFAQLYAPEHVYVHHWQRHDLLVWDNLALQHARTREAGIAAGPRVLQRVMLGSTTFQEAAARAARG